MSDNPINQSGLEHQLPVFKLECSTGAGTCFLVHDEWHLLTARHVVFSKSGAPAESMRILVGFPHAQAEYTATLKKEFPLYDIALLELERAITDYTPLQLATELPAHQTSFEIYGFPRATKQGLWHPGKIMGPAQEGRYEITFDKQYTEHLGGLSGAPMLSLDDASGSARHVMGVLLEHHQANLMVGSMIPSSTFHTQLIFSRGTVFGECIVACCVITSETEERNLANNIAENYTSLLDTIKFSLSAVHYYEPLDGPYELKVREIFANKANYDAALLALCRARVMIFDVTNFEPAVMLLLGIRSVVRRGITICSIGGDFVIGDAVPFPFNIKEINFVSHSQKQYEVARGSGNQALLPDTLIAERITNGLRLFERPQYLDLPTYDAIRNMIHDKQFASTTTATLQVLVLCSYATRYQENNWKRHLSTLLGNARAARQAQQKIEVKRIIDIITPRLVSHTIYQEIRRTGMCVVDWSLWGPSLFFELGIRLACTDSGTVNIIDEEDWNLIKEIKSDPAQASSVLKKHHYIDEIHSVGHPEAVTDTKIVQRFLNIIQQCELLYEFFKPVPYKTDGQRSYYEKIWEVWLADSNRHNEAASHIEGRDTGLSAGDTYASITAAVDWRTESVAVPLYRELLQSAELMFHNQEAGISALLYRKHKVLPEKANMGAKARLLAAWYYLEQQYNYDIEKILADDDKQLIDNYIDIATMLSELLAMSDTKSDYEMDFINKSMDFSEKLEHAKDGKPTIA